MRRIHIFKWPFLIITTVFTLILFLLVYYLLHSKINAIPLKPEAILVSTEKVKKMPLQTTYSFVGTLKPKNAIHIVSEKRGIIQSIHFQSDEPIEKNKLLVTLKHDEQKSALEKAKAAYDNISDQYQRALIIYSKGLFAKSDMMQLKFKKKEAQADWNQALSTYKQCFIRAPFSGQLGIRQINLGEYISVGQSIVNLNSVPILYVDFSVPLSIGNKLHKGMPISINSKAFHKRMTGKIVAIDSSIDSETRSLNIRARVQHISTPFKPGTFVNVNLSINTQQNFLIIPNIAVDYTPYGTSVYIINHDHAELKYIQIKESLGEQFIVLSGLHKGEEIITAGQNKLHDGDLIQIESAR